MSLLERDACLRDLEDAWQGVLAGEGRAVLIGGEAGIGKTALVEQFTRAALPAARVLWGACDPLFTPRPLGPLHDMVAAEAAIPPALLRPDADRATLFAAVLNVLSARPTIAVFEDVHWADDATLDLLRFLGRRVARTRALLIITYRDDEMGPRHPLRVVLGDLAATRRLTLRPLSEIAVRALIGERALDPAALHRQTGGNPFFVTEILAGIGGLPPTVRDAILARAARLSPDARRTLEAAAVIGPRIEPSLLAAATGSDSHQWPALDECLAGGMLLAQGDYLTFRHELARQAVLESIPPSQRIPLHRRTLAGLRAAESSDLGRLAHHAQAAGDRPAILEYAPAAAREAAATGAHRTAATLYSVALPHLTTLPPVEQARLLEAYAQECNLVDRRAEGVSVCLRAAALWRELGEPVRQGAMLAHLVNMLIGTGDQGEIGRYTDEALALLEAHPPGKELAFAYRMKANLSFLSHDYQEAIGWATRSMAVAEGVDDSGAIFSARNVIGTARTYLEYEPGCRYLEENLHAALAAGRESTAAHAYANLGSLSCEMYHLRRAERYLGQGIAFAAERDLDRMHLYMMSWWAMTHLRLSRWEAAAAAAETVLRHPGVSVPSRITALSALGLARARRGDAGVFEALDEALELARPIGFLHRIGLVRAARAEAAWLSGDMKGAAEEAAACYDLALAKRHPWFGGELAYWLARGRNRSITPPGWMAEPFQAEIAGEWQRAAAAWERIGCPYETARALAGGDETAQRDALAAFERLGARPAADALRQQLRAAGVARIPRGPRPATRENPFNLTARQMEIVALLAESLTNAQIAARLQLSPKTVDHHVSAVLAKMDVSTREEAAGIARQQGLLSFD